MVSARDVVELRAGNRSLTGWQQVKVQRGLSRIPSSFDIALTESYPGEAGTVLVRAGDPCTISIGGDLVLTGYIDVYTSTMTGNEHAVRVIGRSKSGDLVDCAAQVPGMQISGGNALDIAQRIAKPYGVTIYSTGGGGADVPQFNINPGETAWEIIDRMSRYSKFVAYDDADGSLVFTQAGSERMSSGFYQGQNVEEAVVSFSMAERFSDYEGLFTSTMIYTVGEGSDPSGVKVKDDGVPRYRKRFVICEQPSPGGSLVIDRTTWEMQRRRGESQRVNIVADSWRDKAGKLWEVNHIAPFDLAALKASERSWLIAEVNFMRDESGSHTGLTLMPVEAFSPEPVIPQPTVLTVEDAEAAANRNPTAKTPRRDE